MPTDVLETNKQKFGSNRKVCFGLFLETKTKNLVCFGVSNLYQNNLNKQNCFETNRNNPKFSEQYQNMLSFKVFRLVFCLFRFNQNIETLCFGIELKQPKQTVSKQTETNRKNPKFSEKITKLLSITLFWLLFCLFRFNRNNETSFSSSFGCFGSKLVSKDTLMPTDVIRWHTKKYCTHSPKQISISHPDHVPVPTPDPCRGTTTATHQPDPSTQDLPAYVLETRSQRLVPPHRSRIHHRQGPPQRLPLLSTHNSGPSSRHHRRRP
jgi:hypothetical protein